MIKLLKNMRRKEVLMVLLCTVLVAVQVYFDLRLPDYMTDLTTLIKTPGSTSGDIWNVGVQMLLVTLGSAVLSIGCGYPVRRRENAWLHARKRRAGRGLRVSCG